MMERFCSSAMIRSAYGNWKFEKGKWAGHFPSSISYVRCLVRMLPAVFCGARRLRAEGTPVPRGAVLRRLEPGPILYFQQLTAISNPESGIRIGKWKRGN